MLELVVCWLRRENRLEEGSVLGGGEFILGSGGEEFETIVAETEVFLVLFLIKNIFIGSAFLNSSETYVC
jgi:hypothetical protein